MDSATNPWNINPSELVKGSANCGPYLSFGNNDSNDNDNSNGSETSGMVFGQDDFDKMLGIGCEDVDHLLSQELKDLDIPLIPRVNKINSKNAENFHEDEEGNENESAGEGEGNGNGNGNGKGNADGDGDTNMLDFEFEDFNGDAYNLNSHESAQKRALSGMAIFGFHKHNKTLSIPNWQKDLCDLQEQGQQLQQEDTAQLPFRSTEETNADGILGQVLLKQQEELRIALEKQQEVNKKLEEQLEANRAQQENLQRALSERETVNQLDSSENASPSRGVLKTSASHAKNTTIGDNGNIIVTSNSTNGCYRFPPPGNLDSLSYVPGSQTTINGSPSRRISRNRNPQIDGDLRGKSEPVVAMANYLRHDAKEETDCSLKNGNDQAAFDSNSFPAQNRTRSPVNARSTVQHLKKESTISTVSTIPQHLDDNENSDVESGGLLGLGIQSIDGKRVTNESYSLKPPPIAVMTSIHGSASNTPVGKQPQFPQKHIFQHTPVKNPQLPVQHHSAQSYYSDVAGSGSSMSESLFRDPMTTPQLKPPAIYSGRRSIDYNVDYNGLIQGQKAGFKANDNQMENNGEPESRFIMAKTPSPILRSQGHFEGSSPQCDITNLSPLKITRKPTTLPRGSIDRYVKELPDKLFECEYHGCGKIFKRRYNIRSHIQTHLEDRPYACDFEGCDKAFVRNHDLVRHKKSHAEKCYACPCGKKFNREDALIVHRSRMICSGGKKYENVVIKKSPRKRGRPKKDDCASVHSSPVKQNVERSGDGYMICKMEEQLRNEMEEYGLLRPPQNLALTSNSLLLSPSSSPENSAIESPK